MLCEPREPLVEQNGLCAIPFQYRPWVPLKTRSQRSVLSVVVVVGGGDDRIITLNIVRGSVLDFASPPPSPSHQQQQQQRIGAIVNAANEGGLGGGGVDGAINTAGGAALWQDRNALPILDGRASRPRQRAGGRRAAICCRTGDAVMTVPAPHQSNYGALHVPYVIHAVGPAYFQYDNDGPEGFAVPDLLLRSAYQQSLVLRS